jgi:hypothetical protein
MPSNDSELSESEIVQALQDIAGRQARMEAAQSRADAPGEDKPLLSKQNIATGVMLLVITTLFNLPGFLASRSFSIGAEVTQHKSEIVILKRDLARVEGKVAKLENDQQQDIQDLGHKLNGVRDELKSQINSLSSKISILIDRAKRKDK